MNQALTIRAVSISGVVTVLALVTSVEFMEVPE
jgi:hypothetical protein